MATYSSSQYTNTTPIPYQGLAGKVHAIHWSVDCAASPATTDTINFGYVPDGARIVLGVLESTDMDTGGSPALTINVGDSGSATRLFSGSTVGQAGTDSVQLAVAGQGYKISGKTLIVGTAGVNAATGAAGTLYLTIFYIID